MGIHAPNLVSDCFGGLSLAPPFEFAGNRIEHRKRCLQAMSKIACACPRRAKLLIPLQDECIQIIHQRLDFGGEIAFDQLGITAVNGAERDTKRIEWCKAETQEGLDRADQSKC